MSDGAEVRLAVEAVRFQLAALAGAPFRLAALAAARFPLGEALDADLNGEAGLADYIRCRKPACSWGVAPGSAYCQSHKLDRQRAQQRAWKARQRDGQRENRPPCCGERRRCEQHKTAHEVSRGYGHSWAAGARGARRVEWLFSVMGQAGRTWGVRDVASRLDRSDDGRRDRLTGTRTPYPDLRDNEEAKQWFAANPGWVDYPLPETTWVPRRRRWAAQHVHAQLERLRPHHRLAEIHRIRHVNGYWPWAGENIHLLVRACGG